MSGTLDPTIAPSAPPPPTYAPPDQSQPQAPTPSQPQQGQPPAQQFFSGDNGWRNLMLLGGSMSQAQNARDSRGLPMNPGMAAFSVGLANALGDQSTLDSRNASTQKTMTETAEQQFKNRALEMQLPFVSQRAQADLDASKATTAKTGVETQGLQANLPFIAPKAQADIDASKATTLKQQMENQVVGSTIGGQIQLQNARNAARLREMTDDQATRGGQTRPDGTAIVYPRLAPSMDLTGSDDVNNTRYQIKDEDQRMALIKNGIEYAGQTGIMNPYQIYSLISQESRWMPRVVADEYTTDANGKRIPTNSTATGLGQVTLSTAKPYLDALGIKPEDQQAYLKDPQNNLNIAMSVLRDKAKAAGVTTADDWSSWENAAAAFGNYHGGTDAYGITNHAYTSQIGHDILVRQELAKKKAGAGGASNQPAAPAVQTGSVEPIAHPDSIMAQRQAAAQQQQQQPTDDHVNPPANPNLFAGPGVPPDAPEPVAHPDSIVAQRQQMAQAATTPPAATPAPPRWSPTNMGGPTSDPVQTASTPPPAARSAVPNTGSADGFITGQQALANAAAEDRQADIWAGQPEEKRHLKAAEQWRTYATEVFKQEAAPVDLRGGEGTIVYNGKTKTFNQIPIKTNWTDPNTKAEMQGYIRTVGPDGNPITGEPGPNGEPVGLVHGTTVTLKPSLQDQEYGRTRGASVGEYRKQTDAEASHAVTDNYNWDNMRHESTGWNMGSFANVINPAKQVLQSTAQLFGINYDSAATTDYPSWEKGAGQIVRDAVRATSGRAAAQEFVFIANSLPHPTNSEDAFGNVADQMQALNDLRQAKPTFQRNFLAAGGSPDNLEYETNKALNPASFLMARMASTEGGTRRLERMLTTLSQTPQGRAEAARMRADYQSAVKGGYITSGGQ